MGKEIYVGFLLLLLTFLYLSHLNREVDEFHFENKRILKTIGTSGHEEVHKG